MRDRWPYRTELSIVFKQRVREETMIVYRYIKVFLCCFFFISSPMTEKAREAAALLWHGRQSIGVQVNRDGLLCVDGDSRETDRNQADVTVRKVCGADVERLKHGLVTHARIKCDPLREDLISSNYVLNMTFDLDLQCYAKHSRMKILQATKHICKIMSLVITTRKSD